MKINIDNKKLDEWYEVSKTDCHFDFTVIYKNKEYKPVFVRAFNCRTPSMNIFWIPELGVYVDSDFYDKTSIRVRTKKKLSKFVFENYRTRFFNKMRKFIGM